jgi:hypothetical protein
MDPNARSDASEEYTHRHTQVDDDEPVQTIPPFRDDSALLEKDASEKHAIRQQSHDKLLSACRTVVESLGEDIEREGLQKTPERMARALTFFTSGYEHELKGAVTVIYITFNIY